MMAAHPTMSQISGQESGVIRNVPRFASDEVKKCLNGYGISLI
jgi:hypothetical protein